MSKIVIKAFVFLFLVHGTLKGNSQQDYLHESILGASFSVYNFDRRSTASELTPAIGLYYLTPVTKLLDLNLKLETAFPSDLIKNSVQGGKKLFVGIDGLVKACAFSERKSIQPFLFSGVKGVSYNGNFYVMTPLGGGVGFNYKNFFLTVNVGYNVSLSQSIYNSSQCSIVFSGLLGLKKKKNAIKDIETASNFLADSDNDGIIDLQDSCRLIPGLAKFNGCPDTDADGIEDKKDQCALVFGDAKYNGCPIPDSDQDGINDEQDSCVHQAGLLRYHGCPIPDSDQDGVNDEDDSCVSIPGLNSNHGCPVIKNELSNEVQKVARNILFKTGSYELLPRSFSSLDSLESILRENLQLKLLIEGHTDNQGTEQSNQTLSANRANAVFNYLKMKGINEVRLKAVGYGQTRPIDVNSTPEGRTRNRRVELKLYY